MNAVLVAASAVVVSTLIFLWSRRSSKTRYRTSLGYRVQKTQFATDDAIYGFVNDVVKKADVSNVDVNTAIVRDATRIISPISATSKEVFKLHRCMAASGFDKMDLLIKLSIHYNLFSRGIKALGTSKHLKILKEITDNKELGCFALTECGAGVLSGFIVETEATWDDNKKEFILNTPHKQARKYWISQGKSADYTLVYATILCNNKKCGTHAFLLRSKDYSVKMGQFGFIDKFFENTEAKVLSNTILIEDVRDKNCIKGADNVIMHFANVRVGKDALLDANYSIDDMLSNKKAPSFLKQMSSLVSGRICIAAAALEGLKACYLYVDKFVSEERKIYVNADLERMPLKRLSHISSVMDEIAFYIERMEIYLDGVETEFANIFDGTSDNSSVSYSFLKKVNVCKAFIPQATIKYMREMSNVVGAKVYDVESPLFMVERGYVGTIAEGDSTLLAIKLASDQLKYGKMSQSSWQEIQLKIDFWMNSKDKKSQMKWYLDNTDTLYSLGMNIAGTEILNH